MQIKVLGITLNDLGLRESLRQTDIFLKNGAINTIAYVSTQKLVRASENEDERQWLEKLDMTICEDTEVLHAAGITSRSRFREVEQNDYLIELLRRIKHNHYSTVLFSDTVKNLNTLEDDLHELMSGIPVKGRMTLEEYEDNREGVFNAINAVAPVVIISRFPYPEGMKMMYEYRQLLNAELWITLSDQIVLGKKLSWIHRVEQHLYKRQFLKKMNRYPKDEKNNTQ